ncbi:MAG: hypothetical protein AB7O32_16860 [Vicinamibacterales bacterium]
MPHFRWVVFCVALVAAATAMPRSAAPAASFSDRVRDLSESPGFFDTDNLISNEMRYLEVVPSLVQGGVGGGVYVGVGPDQNFSYIARVKPAVAYIIDIRRDNLLLHLLFKALFDAAPTRVEYLSLLTGRASPARPAAWRDVPLDEVLGYVDRAKPAERGSLRQDLERRLKGFGVPLSPADLATIGRFHDEFIEKGLALRFTSHNRAPLSYYPTFRMLLEAVDRNGQQWSYMATEEAYQFVRGLQARHAIVPVVGDLAGPHAMRALGTALKADGLAVSAFYASNVEDYLFRRDRFVPFVDNLRTLPRRPGAMIIRSVFRRGTSMSMVQRLDDLLRGVSQGRLRVYGDLVFASRP